MIIDKSKAQDLAQQLNAFLKRLADENGMKHYQHRLSWTPVGFQMKVEMELPEAAEQRLEEQGLFRLGDKVHDSRGEQFIVTDAWKDQVYMDKWPSGGSYKAKAGGLKLLQKAATMKKKAAEDEVPF